MRATSRKESPSRARSSSAASSVGHGVLGGAGRRPPRRPPAGVREPDDARRLALHHAPEDLVALGQQARPPARPDDVDARETGAPDRRALHVSGGHGPVRRGPHGPRPPPSEGRRRLQVAERALLDRHAPALAQRRGDRGVGLLGRVLHRPGPAPSNWSRFWELLCMYWLEYVLPAVMLFMFYSFPAGLTLYWTVNTVLTVAQQWWIHREEPAVAPAATPA